MSRTIDTLLLVALPASGKSELRRYLSHLDPAVARRELHVGPIVALDDYPYVHLMRRVGQELRAIGEPPLFTRDDASPFMEPLEWGTLINLLNEDYATLGDARRRPDSSSAWLFARIDRARRIAGVRPAFAGLDGAVRRRLESALEEEAGVLWSDLAATAAAWSEESTVVIEFARGGPEGASMPLTPPHGYAYSLARLSTEILVRASILYVWVTHEQSLRRNEERAWNGREGDASILHHGVPASVMSGNYGVDDLRWLMAEAGGDAVAVGSSTGTASVPAVVFDNRTDVTSFLRDDPVTWPPAKVAELHARLRVAFDDLAGRRGASERTSDR